MDSLQQDGVTPSPVTPEGFYGLLRDRNFSLYLVGRLIASIGQQMLTVAIGWELYERTNSALALGLVGLSQILPLILLTLPAGHVADNSSRKGIIQNAELVMAVCSLGLAFLSWQHSPVLLTYVCLFISGVARSFLWPASSAFLVQIVKREQVSKAITWNSGSFQLSCVLGPVAGGVMIALSHHAVPVYLVNAVASTLCVICIFLIRVEQPVVPRQKMTFESLAAGAAFVFKTRLILGTITLDMFAVLFGGATALLPIYARDILHVGPTGLGWLQAALPLGSVTMALVLAHLPPLREAGKKLLWSLAGFGLATIIFGFSTHFLLSFAMLFVCGAMDNVNVVIRHTLVQVMTPDEMRGRVSAINSLFIGTSNELGGFESGLVAQLFGTVPCVVFGGLATIGVVVLISWICPEVRKYAGTEGPH